MSRFLSSLDAYLGFGALLLAIGLGLGGCATKPTLDTARAGRPETYTANAHRDPKYGPWWIDARTCTIHAAAADFTLATDGKMDTPSTIHLRASYAVPLAAPPVAELSHFPVAVPVEGGRGVYRIIIPYTSTAAAQMLNDSTFLIIHYQPVNSAQVLESSFSAKDLIFALGDLGRNCN